MKRRPSLYFFFVTLIALSLIGIIGKLNDNPVKFLQGIAVTAIVIGILYVAFRKFSGNGPRNSEQQAFRKAARKSRKRLAQKGSERNARRPARPLVAVKRRSSHLTVIEGNRGNRRTKEKKKNRAHS